MCEKFNELYDLDVSKYVEKKNGLDYLSWAYAVKEFTCIFPNWSYEIKKFTNDKNVLVPYMADETGIMIETSITADGVTKTMWLPVMDNANRAMKLEPYEVVNKYGKATVVASATMFDVNKTIMRCLVKNMAMFGLGLKLYTGEDLPETEAEPKKEVVVSKTEKPTFKCEECGKEITTAENRYSFDKFGKALCRDCQKKASQNS